MERPTSSMREDYSQNSELHARLRIIYRVARHMRTNFKKYIWLAIVAAIGLALYSYVTSPATVNVAEVKTIETTQTLGAIGKVRGEKSADLGMDANGIVSHIFVKEGDVVHTGQLLLSTDAADLNDGVVSQQAALSSALADLTKVSKGPLPSELRQAYAQLQQADMVGRAKIAEAQAKLRDLQSGNRPQEIAAAQAELRKQQTLLAKAQRDLQRNQMRVKAGALPQTSLDQAQTDVEAARASVAAQQAQVANLKSGSRADQIVGAKAGLNEAVASHTTSVQAARETINTLKANPRPEDVTAARAKVDQARAELGRAVHTRSKTDLRAPYDGVVAKLLVDEGQSVSQGQKVIAFQQISKPIIEVETDEDNLATLAVGQKAVVSSDAYSDKNFDAVVYDIGSQVNSERGTITVKLRPVNDVSWLRPDLTVNVNIITGVGVKSVILPTDTVTRVGGKQVVFVAKDGKAVPVTITTGAAGPDGVVVKGLIHNGDQVIRNAAKISPGEDVNPEAGG